MVFKIGVAMKKKFLLRMYIYLFVLFVCIIIYVCANKFIV